MYRLRDSVHMCKFIIWLIWTNYFNPIETLSLLVKVRRRWNEKAAKTVLKLNREKTHRSKQTGAKSKGLIDLVQDPPPLPRTSRSFILVSELNNLEKVCVKKKTKVSPHPLLSSRPLLCEDAKEEERETKWRLLMSTWERLVFILKMKDVSDRFKQELPPSNYFSKTKNFPPSHTSWLRPLSENGCSAETCSAVGVAWVNNQSWTADSYFAWTNSLIRKCTQWCMLRRKGQREKTPPRSRSKGRIKSLKRINYSGI